MKRFNLHFHMPRITPQYNRLSGSRRDFTFCFHKEAPPQVPREVCKFLKHPPPVRYLRALEAVNCTYTTECGLNDDENNTHRLEGFSGGPPHRSTRTARA